MTMEIWIYLLAFLIGTSMGSFANVLIHRLPERLSIVSPGSRCPSCGTPIRWYDNIPVLSFLALRGRCRDCGRAISFRYPLVEVVCGTLFAAVVWRLGLRPSAAALALFSWALVVITFIDIDHRIIPDAVSLPGTAFGLLFSLYPGFPRPLDSVLGVVFGAGFLFLVLWGYEKVMGEEGMGMGDVKLLAMIGAFLGWQALPLTILVSSMTGSLVGMGYALVKGRSVRKFPVPFGPFLALGALVHIFFGLELMRWYLGSL